MAAVAFTIGLERSGLVPGIEAVTNILYQWAILLGGFGLLLGVANVALVHIRRIQGGDAEWPYSLLLLLALLAVLISGLLAPAGAQSPLVNWIFDAIIAPGQAALFSLVALFMVAAAYQYLRFNRPGGLWMLAGVLLMLTAQTPMAAPRLAAGLAGAMAWTLDVPAMAVFRGVLLGSGLALLAAGIRYLIHRP